jgi:hypothetical protein
MIEPDKPKIGDNEIETVMEKSLYSLGYAQLEIMTELRRLNKLRV